jgi:hypothetical protein
MLFSERTILAVSSELGNLPFGSVHAMPHSARLRSKSRLVQSLLKKRKPERLLSF